MQKIAIYGAGGFGREVACLLNIINKREPTWDFIGFFDDGRYKGEQVSHFGPVLGGIDELNNWEEKLAVAIAIGSPKTIKSIVEKIKNDRIYFPNIIHPSFVIVDVQTFTIGHGNIIQGGCYVSCDVCIGDFNVLNGAVVIGHDANVGNYNVFMPDIRISGGVHIGECNLFGVGSIVLQEIKIENGVRLGAGSVLMTKPKENSLYMGNPAKIFKY